MAHAQEPKPILVVLGATGFQGGAVLRWFAAHPLQHNYALRGVSRNPSSDASRALASLGVEMVAGDFLDRASLAHAFAGATVIFANTDSLQMVFQATQRPELLAAGQTPQDYAKAQERQMGLNIRDAAVATAGLQRLIWSSVVSPLKWSRGRFSHMQMADSKEEISDLLWAAEGLKGKYSVLMLGFYAENAFHSPDLMAPKKQPDGAYELSLPIAADATIPVADVEKDTGSWVNALLQVDPGLTLVGQSEAVSYSKWLQIWGRRHDFATRYQEVTLEQFCTRGEMAQSVGELTKFCEEYGFTGGIPDVVYPQQLRDRGIEIQTSSVEDHIMRTDWSKVLH